MRTLRLARVAAEAEGLFLRRRLRGIVIRVVLGMVAGFFLVGAIAVLHAYLWLLLRALWGGQLAALAVAGADAILAIILGLLAMRSPADSIASDAIVVRDKAITEMRSLYTMTSMLRPVGGLLFEQWLLRRRRKRI